MGIRKENQRKTRTKFLLLASLGVFSLGALPSCKTVAEDIIPDLILIANECERQPYNWVTEEDNPYALPIDNHYGTYADGYDIQVAKMIEEYLGKEVVIIQSQWESLITDLQYGAVTLIVGGLTDTEVRREVIDFTDEYYRAEMVFITQKDVADRYEGQILDEAGFLEFIKDQTIVSMVATITDDMLAYFEERYGLIRGTPLQTGNDCAMDVSSGTAFACFDEMTSAATYVNSFDNLGYVRFDQNLFLQSGRFERYGVSIGIRKGMNKLKDALNGFLSTFSSEERETLMNEAIERSGI